MKYPLLGRVAIVAIVASLQPNLAFAQTDADSDAEAGNAPIIVTAQRREQSLQDVPVALTSLGENGLQERTIDTVTDLNTAVPNLNVSRSVKGQTIFLRGVGNVTTAPGQEQNVALYIDGVYYPSVASNVFSFDNIERIEVLRGPQGTLFGRNTTGGLVHVITADPADEFEGQVRVGYGNYETFEIGGYLSGPLADGVGAYIGANLIEQNDGWGENLTTGEDVYFTDDFTLRGRLVFEPSTTTKITLNGLYSDIESDLGVVRNRLPCTPTLDGQCLPLPPTGPGGAFDIPDYQGFYNITSAMTDQGDEIEFWAVSARLEQDIGFANLSATVAYSELQVDERIDTDTVPALVAQSRSTEVTDSFSAELLLSSQPDSAVQWIGGLYYINMGSRNDPFSVDLPGTVIDIFADLKTDSLAVFGQVTVPLGDRTNLTGGARYTVDWRSLDASLFFNNNLVGGPTFQEERFSEPTWRISIDHRLSDEALIYALVATGFKSGLWNTTSPIPNNPAVRPETLIDYEVGAKLDLFDRRVRVNLAGFYYDYTDLQQLAVVFAGAQQTVLLNAADAVIFGGEIDIVAQLTDRLILRASAGYTDSEYQDFTGAPLSQVDMTTMLPFNVAGGFDASGLPLARVTDFTGSIGMDYTIPAFGGDLQASWTLYHNGGFNFDVDGRLRQEPYELLNASITWTDPSEAYSIRLWGKNLTDTQHFTTMNNGNNRPDSVSAAAPLTFGATFAVNF